MIPLLARRTWPLVCEERNHRSDVGGLAQPLQRCEILQVLRHLNVMSLVQLSRNLVEPGLVSGHQNHGMAVPLSRSPSLRSALPRLFCVSAHLSGTRSRVYSSSAEKQSWRTAVGRNSTRLVLVGEKRNVHAEHSFP